jgi:hypothetical protein
MKKYLRAFRCMWLSLSPFSLLAWMYLIIGPLVVFMNVGGWWRIIVLPFIFVLAPLLLLMEAKRQELFKEAEDDVDTL